MQNKLGFYWQIIEALRIYILNGSNKLIPTAASFPTEKLEESRPSIRLNLFVASSADTVSQSASMVRKRTKQFDMLTDISGFFYLLKSFF